MEHNNKLFAITGSINYLVVVFLNAFTDLGHKIIIQNTIFKVYDGSQQIVLTAIVNALILLPFILLFSPSGFLADRYPKNKIMQHSALFAVIITLGITFAYYNGYFLFAFFLTFLLALQSALYGPAKYGYIKELFGDNYISSANGAAQAVTTVAILGGIIFYSFLFEGMYTEDLQTPSEILEAIAPIGWLLVGGSIVEWYLASKLPNKVKTASTKVFQLQRYIRGFYLKKNLTTVTRKKEIFDAIIALGLFWSISQVVLAIFGEYAKDQLGITNTIIVQGVMALAGIGIVLGSIFAAKLSKYYINIGLSGIGAIGITLLVVSIPFIDSIVLLSVVFILFGILSGFILVPLNAQIQHLSSQIHLGTILAANNFIQNIFMFCFLVLTTIFAYYGMDAQVLFYLMGGVGIYLSVILFKRYMVSIFWATMQLVTLPRHHYIYHGLEHIPQKGAALILSNHVSWLDWVMIQLPIKRQINYMMDKQIYHWKYLHPVFKAGETIPVSPKGFKDAFKDAHQRLHDGKIVALFPEGAISKNGKLGLFHRGFELIKPDYDGMIIPCYIGSGIFGSVFAKYKPKHATRNLFKRRVVNIYFATPVPNTTSAQEIQTIIQAMKEQYETQQA